MRLDHVQVSCPPGGEDVARAFYRDALGMTEVEKPEQLKARGGCWFRSGAAEIHVGVEEGFTATARVDIHSSWGFFPCIPAENPQLEGISVRM